MFYLLVSICVLLGIMSTIYCIDFRRATKADERVYATCIKLMLIATRTAHCVVEFHPLAAAAFHVTGSVLTCICSNTLRIVYCCRRTFWPTSSLCFPLWLLWSIQCRKILANLHMYVSTCTTVIKTLHSSASTVFIWSPRHGSFVSLLTM